MTRRIAVITGTRAEYGILRPLCQAIMDDPDTELQLMATGMHLAPEFGLTVREIEADGLPIARRVEMLVSSDTPVGISKSMGLGMIGFADAFADLQPHMIVVLGDRFELLAAAAAAMSAGIPIAHIHGGETTEGAIDEAIRHSITKMAHIHFPSTDFYRNRIIQMGEDPARVFNYGAPTLDNIRALVPASREELSRHVGLDLASPLILATFHPVTLEYGQALAQFEEMLAAFDTLPGTQIVITHSNADAEGRTLIQAADAFAARHKDRVRAVTSLGQRRYHSMVSISDLVVGNSSSGIAEVPHFSIPTVNIGDRQKGRYASPSVIHCPPERGAIAAAIAHGFDPAFREAIKSQPNPYGNGTFAPRALALLKSIPLGPDLLKKRFHDLSFPATPTGTA